MTVSVGRVRPCPVLGTSSWRWGTTRARRGRRGLLNAELMLADGWVD